MAVDFEALALAPIYEAFGVPATIQRAGDAEAATFTAIDQTRGVEISIAGADLATIKPVAMVRAGDLADRAWPIESLLRAAVTIAGKNWRVVNYKPQPGPNGEASGEYALVLVEA